jgi:glycosyltransferase involved in cell wall biosynthesis
LIKLPQPDIIIVGHPGYFRVHLAWVLRRIFCKKAKLVYDVFIPLYEALVEDRELVSPGTFLAWLLHRFEKSCCRITDLNLIDTNIHAQYLIHTFGLCPEKVARIFVGATIKDHFESSFEIKPQKFNILFVGTYIPLHGIDVILSAARILADRPEIKFVLVGSGQLRSHMGRLTLEWKLKNVEFVDWVAPEHLYAFIRNHDLSLGIFGTTPKTKRVIPSKIFDICKAGVPFITSDSPAIREAFSHCENAYLIPAGNAPALAKAILHLHGSPDLRKQLAVGAGQTDRAMFSLNCLGNALLSNIHNI